jgi:hypothetical protein
MSMFTLQFAVEAADDAQVAADGTLAMENALREVLCEELNRVKLFEEDQIGIGHGNVDGTLMTLLARVRVSNVHILQYLRDLVLSTSETWCPKEKGPQEGQEKSRQEGQGDFSERIKAAMQKTNRGTVELNKGAFVENYERALYHFDTMTEEQADVHTKCHEALRRQRKEVLEMIPTVRIDGAAGTGKTFLALHDLLIKLRQDRTVLFVARNTALGYFAAGWAYRRLRLHMTSKRAMEAMEHFWTLSLDEGEVKLRKCKITEQTSEITWDGCPDSMYPSVYRLCLLFSFELVVVDEAHHVYGYNEDDRKSRDFCDFMERCCKGCKDRILFSDVSQSWKGEYDTAMKRFPPHKSFNMDVVVRNTERVVLGAMVCTVPLRFPTSKFALKFTSPCGFDAMLPSSFFLRLLRRHFSLS